MGWISDEVEEFRGALHPHLAVHIATMCLFGIGLGMLVATAANMDGLGIHYYCHFANSHTK